MMRRYLITLVVLVIFLLTSCAPTAPATPNTSPPTHHFGIVIVRQDIDGITRLGIRWDRTLVGPFIWGQIEPEKGRYEWQEVDEYVQKVQNYDIATVATIRPFAEWDQANWGPAGTTSLIFEDEGLCRSRHKPYDMEAYRRFVSALVERYDDDGEDDMPGLRYPIKYWEASNEPSMQNGYFTSFEGSPEDYLEVLKATYKAVKEADPEAKVLHAGMAEMYPPVLSFWKPIFKEGSSYFDIANIHCSGPSELSPKAELIVPEFKKLLSKYGIDKPIWVTETQFEMGESPVGYISPEEHAQTLVKSYVVAFAWGADNIFYNFFRAYPPHPPRLKRMALIDENDEIKPAYYALRTLIQKLDKFTSAEKLAEGQYKFIVEGKAVYVLWGSGKIPEEIKGEVLVTDIYSKETRINSSAITLTESPIFVESTRISD